MLLSVSPYRSCQATPLLPPDGVGRREGGHGGRHWDRDGHPVSLPTRGPLPLLFVCENRTHEYKFPIHTLYIMQLCPWFCLSHLGAELWDWAERFCAAPPDMAVGCKDEIHCAAGAMEPDSEPTACSLCRGLTPLRWEERDRINSLK